MPDLEQRTQRLSFRYRDFRESNGPSYDSTLTYWNVTAARLAFILTFEHLIFVLIYVMQWLVSDVPKSVRERIERGRFIDQRERWSSKNPDDEDKLKDVLVTSHTMSKIIKHSNRESKSLMRPASSSKSGVRRNGIPLNQRRVFPSMGKVDRSQ